MDPLQKQTPAALYVRYIPADRTANPKSQTLLPALMCIRLENSAIPSSTKETSINIIPAFLCGSPLLKTLISNSAPVHKATEESISSIASSFPKVWGL
jgi:hypothetical protein